MKGKLEFDLSQPDDKLAFKVANAGEDMALVLWEFLVNGHRKYESYDNQFLAGYEKAQDEIREELLKRGVDVENINYLKWKNFNFT